MFSRKRWLAVLLIACLLVEPLNSKRSGGGGGRSRGASGARTGGFGGGSRSRSGAGVGGGYRPANSGSSYPRGNYGVGGHNTGGGAWSGGGAAGHRNDYGHRSGTGGGGWFGSGGSSSHHSPKFNKGSGIGSMVRSNTFKNAIVGAAAGYLTYQAGKHLIRSAMAPMMYGGRNYYWGQQYYQPRPNMQMCRMPISSGDPQFGSVYFQDQTRPKEIVWSCSAYEHCCGTECCPGGGGMGGYGAGGYGGGGGYGNNYYGWNGGYGRPLGVGSLLILLLLSMCGCFLVYRMCNRNRYQQTRQDVY